MSNIFDSWLEGTRQIGLLLQQSLFLGFILGVLLTGVSGAIWFAVQRRNERAVRSNHQHYADQEAQTLHSQISALEEALAKEKLHSVELEKEFAQLHDREIRANEWLRQLPELREQLINAQAQRDKLEAERLQLTTEVVDLRARVAHEIDAKSRNERDFDQLAQKILTQRQQDLSTQHNPDLAHLLGPLQQQLPELREQLANTQAQRDALEAERLQLTAEVVDLRARLASETEARSRHEQDFNHLAQKILEAKQKDLSKHQDAGLSHLLGPLQQQLDTFRNSLDQARTETLRERTQLAEQLRRIEALNQSLSTDAQALTQALRGDNKIQGNWGELVLERVLESAGLTLGREYQRETVLYDSQGRTYRPDVLVLLPDQRYVIVDAKVSLKSYEQALKCEDKAQQSKALKAHVQSLRQHIDGLSEREYERLDGIHSLDFVLLFIPIEGAFQQAMVSAPELFDEAFQHKVVLVSPTTLLITLRTIHNIWRYQSQSQNAEKIAKQAGELIDQFVSFTDELDQVERHLVRAHERTGQARRRLVSGRGNLVDRAKKIQQLGVNSRQKLPESTTDTVATLPQSSSSAIGRMKLSPQKRSVVLKKPL